MLDILRSISSLLLAILFLVLGHGLFTTLIGVRAGLEGYATETTGAIMSAYFLGQIIGVFWGRRVVRAVGHIRAFAAFAALVSILPLAHAYLVEPWAWALFRMAGGASLIGLFIVTESWINSRATNLTRGRVLSIYMITYYGSLGGGQFLLNVGDPLAPDLFVLASALFSLAIVPVALTQSQAPAPVPKIQFRLLDLYRLSPLAVIGSISAGLTNAAFLGMGPVFARDIGLPLSDIAWFMGLVILGGMALQWPVGRVSDRVDRRIVIVTVSATIVAAGMGVLVGAEHGRQWLFVSAVLFGGGMYAMYPICTAHAHDHVSEDQRVDAAGGLMIIYGIAATVGPLLASAVMGQVGPSGLFEQVMVVQVLLILFALYRVYARRRGVMAVVKRRFLHIPRSTPVIAALADEPAPPESTESRTDSMRTSQP
ncbi:MAG: MFS transporter [Rhodobacterales bacterium]|nr:MFS transporter [Rhodobacterales bacterium]